MNEGAHNQEKESLSKEEVAALLREQHPDSKAELLRWTTARESQVENNLESRVQFELDRADLYFQAGLIEDFDVSIDAAIEQAEQEGRNDVAQQITEWAKTKQ
jgi:hypothetical protein